MSKLSLTIWRLEQTCKFVLSWGQGTQLTAEIALSSGLLRYFEVWQEAYLNYYRSGLRAKVKQSGSFQNPSTDWRVRLAQAEANLLTEFDRWLNQSELSRIRQQIAKLVVAQQNQLQQHVDLSLQCDDDELARLPWETWEVGQEFGAAGLVRLSRAPENIQQETRQYRRQGKMRLLAIIGDDTKLDFQGDLQSLETLGSIIEVHQVGWKTGKNIPALREEICHAIEDPKGWDVLFFAGHSNETNITGGELAIAPNTAILLSEIAPKLAIARERGLKFALFNSCKGLSLANKLIEQGMGQVAIMREPIRNDVAHAFLAAFAKALSGYEDVHQALYSACRNLKTEHSLRYPSASLIPSLFQHPKAIPFKLEPLTLKARLKQWLPTKTEAVILGAFALLSLMPGVQRQLIEQRLLFQGQAREMTGQFGQSFANAKPPPVLLVEIDSQSISKGNITAVRPTFSRQYLSELVTKIDELGLSELGLDYLLDRDSETGDAALRAALEKAEDNGMNIIFATFREDGNWLKPDPDVAQFSPKQLGDAGLFGSQESVVLQAKLDAALSNNETFFPFSQKLADAQSANRPSRNEVQTNWITQLSYYLGQTWLHPLLDYSIPPEQVYQHLPAWQLLAEPTNSTVFQDLDQQIALIAAGYDDAGTATDGEDNKLAPRVMGYWWNSPSRTHMSGGEVHAYHIHHLQNTAFITPLPDLWWVGMAALLGKWGRLTSWNGWSKRNQFVIIGIGSAAYGLLSLELYIVAQILLPWLLPVTVLGSYRFISWRDIPR